MSTVVNRLFFYTDSSVSYVSYGAVVLDLDQSDGTWVFLIQVSQTVHYWLLKTEHPGTLMFKVPVH